MKIIEIVIYFSILFLIPAITASQPADNSPQSNELEFIMKAVGIDHQLTQLPEDLRSQFQNNPFGLSNTDNEQMIELFSNSFIESSLWDEARSAFSNEYDSTYADSTVEWLQKDRVKKMINAEDDFYTIQGIRNQVVRKYELEQNPPSDIRINTVEKLIDATKLTEMTIDSYAIIFRAFINAFDILNEQQSFSRSQIDSFVQNYRQQLQSGIPQELLNRHLIIYYNLDDQQLEYYTSYFNTEAGKWLNSATNNSIHSAFQKAADRFIESVRNRN